MGQRWGYGRVSTRDQHTRAQHDALIQAGVDPANVYVEKASTRLAKRPVLEELRGLMRKGDTLTITKLDRLGRSTLDLIAIADDLKDKGIELEILAGNFSRDTAMGRAFFTIASAFAELERDMISERTRDGLAATTGRGRNGGRHPKLGAAQIQHAKDAVDGGTPVAAVARELRVSRQTLYRSLARAA